MNPMKQENKFLKNDMTQIYRLSVDIDAGFHGDKLS